MSNGKGIFVFIDAENVRNTCNMYGYKDIDYVKLHDWFIEKMHVKRIYVYAGLFEGDYEKEAVLKELQRIGYYVYSKKVMMYRQKPVSFTAICKGCGQEVKHKMRRDKRPKANCDAEMTLDIIRFGVRKKYSEIVTFSGDGDFASVYEYVARELRKKVTVYASADKRTSTKVKELNQAGVVKMEDVRGLFSTYAIKKEPPEGDSFD